MWRRRFQALKTSVEIVAEPPSIAADLSALFGTYPDTGREAELGYWVRTAAHGHRIRRNDVILADACAEIDVAPIIELDLFKQVVELAEPAVVLHAAAVLIEGAALVMVGNSGAGKTTLTRALLERGGQYLSEECVAIDAAGEVYGLARPIHLDEAPGVDSTAHPYRWVGADGAETATTMEHPAQVASGPHRLGGVCLIEYRPGETLSAEPLSAGEAIERLWPCLFGVGSAVLPTLIGLLRARPVCWVRSPQVEASLSAVLSAHRRALEPEGPA